MLLFLTWYTFYKCGTNWIMWWDKWNMHEKKRK